MEKKTVCYLGLLGKTANTGEIIPLPIVRSIFRTLHVNNSIPLFMPTVPFDGHK